MLRPQCRLEVYKDHLLIFGAISAVATVSLEHKKCPPRLTMTQIRDAPFSALEM